MVPRKARAMPVLVEAVATTRGSITNLMKTLGELPPGGWERGAEAHTEPQARRRYDMRCEGHFARARALRVQDARACELSDGGTG